MPADIYPLCSAHRESCKLRRKLLRLGVMMKLVPLHADPEHRHVYTSEAGPVRQWGPMNAMQCACGECKLFSAIAE